ncbi:MAG: LysR substrate-binding domain-containing protein [Pseudomonadota bacterium]
MRLPNWKLLTAFEAVARHRNFSRAAAELNVLQPAISRRVAELEADLGLKLVRRTRPQASLTAEGEVLCRALSASFVQVQGALEQITARRHRRPIVVKVTIGFANCFLLSRLGAFRYAHPEYEFELVSRDLNEDYREEGADIIIVFDPPGRLPGVQQLCVFREELIAVAAPGRLEGRALSLEDLVHRPRLWLGAGSHVNDWDRFLAGTGARLDPEQQSHRFNSFMVYLQATLNGDGIALGWEHLLDDYLTSGQLQRACDHQVKTPRGYYCCLTEQGQIRPGAEAFMEWMGTLVAPDETSS